MDDPRINAIPYAPSPPEAPTVPSVPSDEEVYGQERYAGYRAEYPHYAPSTPGMSQSVRFDPTPFVVGGMQTDPLVQRDFKDDLVRAAGAVTPGAGYEQPTLHPTTPESASTQRPCFTASTDSSIPRGYTHP
ncbi:hypothetical protein NPX13_g8691 [Xylaria arbuscula]|uniref:Uncharacterized protein n=1 Tax=Xylaria arbuscula TaxID=114810 RepID=A0A9W8TI53_9PEZI|nr:hypothetical protein NPX13_g8691 [Xylaria arbuscula]